MGPGALYGGLDLPVFTALRTFDIILHFPEEEVSDEKLIKSWGHMLNLLILVTKAAFDTISKITVVVDPEPATSNLHRFIVFPRPWLELQIMLETLDLDTLTKVDFKVGGIGPGSIFDLEKVGRVLPRIKQRGILQVS